MRLVTLIRARSATEAALRVRPPSPTACASSCVETQSRLAAFRLVLDIEGLRFGEFFLQVAEPLAIRRARLRIEHLAGIGNPA